MSLIDQEQILIKDVPYYVVTKTLGYGNTINILYTSENVFKLHDYRKEDIPHYMCGGIIVPNRFHDNFTVISENYNYIDYEALYEAVEVSYVKKDGSYIIYCCGSVYHANDFNNLIEYMDNRAIGWNEKYD